MHTYAIKSPYKTSTLSLGLSTLIISNAYFVSVYHTYSSYKFIFTWANKSIVNHFEFFYIGFLLNWVVLGSIIFVVIIWFKPLQLILLKRFWLILSVLVMGIVMTNLGFLIFDTDFEPLFSLPKHPYSNQVYCHYFTIGRDNYLNSGGCLMIKG